jgi:hypothetical protein
MVIPSWFLAAEQVVDWKDKPTSTRSGAEYQVLQPLRPLALCG